MRLPRAVSALLAGAGVDRRAAAERRADRPARAAAALGLPEGLEDRPIAFTHGENTQAESGAYVFRSTAVAARHFTPLSGSA